MQEQETPVEVPEQVLLVTFAGEEPRQIITTRGYYVCAHIPAEGRSYRFRTIKHDRTTAALFALHPDQRLWISPDATLLMPRVPGERHTMVPTPHDALRAQALPKLLNGWTPETILAEVPLAEEILYCQVCKLHYLPTEHCRHIAWSPAEQQWVGWGVSDWGNQHLPALRRLVAQLPLAAQKVLYHGIARVQFPGRGDWEKDVAEIRASLGDATADHELALLWLTTLDPARRGATGMFLEAMELVKQQWYGRDRRRSLHGSPNWADLTYAG